MTEDVTIGVGVVGLGFMGQMHIQAYHGAREAGYGCRLVAVCDCDADRRAGRVSGPWNLGVGSKSEPFDANSVRAYADADELLTDKAVDLVSICTPTDTHVDLAMRALAAGKHVVIEKPVAVRSADVHRVAQAAAAADTLCMPALCMRFWPEWAWLKGQIDSGAYGAVRSAVFQRLGSVPGWSAEFYCDPERSGGALVDLHVHDADFVRWCFGAPESVVSTGSIHHVTTIYRYPSGPEHVVAEGGWVPAPGFAFRMRYVVAWEQATADFDFGRDSPLMLTCEGNSEPVLLDAVAAYEGEIRHMLDAIVQHRRSPDVTIEDAEAVARLLEAERESLQTGLPIRFGA